MRASEYDRGCRERKIELIWLLAKFSLVQVTLRNLTLKQLHAVAAIARLGRVTAAARELNLTPAALTSRLKQLEEAVGLSLFDRTGDGLKPTDAGREVLWAIDTISVAIDACESKLEGLKGLAGGRVAIGAVSTAKYFAPQAIAAFSRAYPSVEISLFVGNRGSTIESLRDYEIDLAIMGRPPGDFEVEAAAFGEHPLVVIAPPNHPLAHRERLSKGDLGNEPFLVREDGSGTRTVFEEFMAGIAVKRARLGIEIGSNETIKQAVMAGLGIALISAHTVSVEVESRRLIVLAVDGLPIRRQWFAVRRADKARGPAAQAFWDFLVATGAEWLPTLPAPLSGRDAPLDKPVEASPRAGKNARKRQE